MKIRYFSQTGRSMIEMLGVLAIIGILSIAGISGFNKAMTKHKINRLTEEYISFLQDTFLKYKDEWVHMQRRNNNQRIYTATYLSQLGLPTGWKKDPKDKYTINDSLNNSIIPFTGYNNETIPHFGFDFYIQNPDSDTNFETCRQFITNVILPFKEELYRIFIYQDGAEKNRNYWYGTAHCSSNHNCLSEMNFNNIEQFCASCSVREKRCLIIVNFKP